ncbi:hypothetical protein Malapachy_1514 [Malassezia pachydermatis]|uniref:Uncharacterized protein n=1 Tax=Malassezia pachydermatis TaxID=77020 RepID=A0A0M8MSV8_9BASI|nr:hypothetical protein Malapachy_1514 [Malassezia pachydermatis]KOS13110.1 hypothetical protein Malapachy_1514 [Malassezia pachydermatis]
MWTTTADTQPLAAKAIAGVLVLLSILVSVRLVFRTVRSTIQLVFWLIRWGLILFVVLWAWLWWRRDTDVDTHLSLLTQMTQGTSAAVLGLVWRAAQRPDLWQPMAQHVADAWQASSRRKPKRRTPRSARTSSKKGKTDTWTELAEALGWDDLVAMLQDPAPKSKKKWKTPSSPFGYHAGV